MGFKIAISTSLEIKIVQSVQIMNQDLIEIEVIVYLEIFIILTIFKRRTIL